MPELAEIRRYGLLINQRAAALTFQRATGYAGGIAGSFRIHAETRGKELRLRVTPVNGGAPQWLLFTHGLVGRWAFSSADNLPNAARVSFYASNNEVLSFVDVQKMGKWQVYTSARWGDGRGPDPIDEFEDFKQNILTNLKKKDFELPICEALLNQKYFNGIGNYLRAEILYRCSISPFTKAFAVLQDQAQASVILRWCRALPLEVLSKGLDKYGSPAQLKEFEAWLQCYGKSTKATDKGGRAVWSFPDQHKRPIQTPPGDTESILPVSNSLLPTTFPALIAASSAVSSSSSAAHSSSPSTYEAAVVRQEGLRASSGLWQEKLRDECSKPYVLSLCKEIDAEVGRGQKVFPPPAEVLDAFNHCPFDKVSVLLLGQDPYHDDGQAHGLSFSVKPGVAVPPSLRNMYTELQSDVGMSPPNHGCLVSWAAQGVLLLNAGLTVRAHEANSHAGKGWERFTDAVIDLLSARGQVVFLLWGGFAQKKETRIDASRNLILKTAHPSPLSVVKFRGCRHFSAVNKYLQQVGRPPINWQVPSEDVARKLLEGGSLPASSTVPAHGSSVSATPTAPSSLFGHVQHAPRVTVMAPDIQLARRIRGDRDGADASQPAHTTVAWPSFVAPVSTQVLQPSLFGAGANATAANAFAGTGAASAASTAAPARPLTRLLVLLAMLGQHGLLDSEQKGAIKDMAFQRNPIVFATLEAFEADAGHDLAEAADTFRLILRSQRS